MRTLPLERYLPGVSPIAFGCMGLGGSWDASPISKQDMQLANEAVDAALDSGINFFDHADIYTKGKAEQTFGKIFVQRPSLRDQVFIQSKCAIRFEDELAPGRYDHSAQWVEQSVDGILRRLGTEYLDVLLLHRPDPLMEVDEVAETFSKLHKTGKVKHFGVSNMHRYQMELLNTYLAMPIVVNQLEMSLAKHDFLEQGVTMAMTDSAEVGFSSGTLEYCQLNQIQIQSWGSLAKGLYTGASSDSSEAVLATSQLVTELAEKYEVAKEAVVLGWMMRLPYAIQPVIGTTSKHRIANCSQAPDFAMAVTREDWYRLYVAARGKRLP